MEKYYERAEYAWTKDSIRLITTPSMFARSSLFYVQEIGHFKTLPPYFTERAHLDSFLIVYTMKGRGRLNYQGESWTLSTGQVFFIDCQHYQYYSSILGEDWEIVWVHLNGASTQAYYEQYTRQGKPVLLLSPDSKVPKLIASTLKLHHEKSFHQELLASQLLVELLTELVLVNQGTALTASSQMPPLIQAVLKYIDKHYSEKLTLEHLAIEHAVNKYHLAKQFKKYTGFSPGQYLIHIRINRSQELLKYSEHSVAYIAEQTGIDNVSHFINLFKERTGQTPLVYRKTWQPWSGL